VRDPLSYSARPPDENCRTTNQDRRHYRPGVESPETLERLIREGLNIARLDLGIRAVEQMAVIQKQLIGQASRRAGSRSSPRRRCSNR
jgi:hypothetical protein